MAFTPQYDAWAGPLPMEIGWLRNGGGTDASIAKHKNAGFDFVIAVTASVSDLDRIEAADVWAITSRTSAKANHAAVRGWYIADEPDSAEGSPPAVTMPSAITSTANSVRAADPRNLPLFLGLGEGLVCGPTETATAGWGSLGRGSRWSEPDHGDGDYVDYVDGGGFEWVSTFNYAVAGTPLQPKFRQVAGGPTQTPTEMGLRQPDDLASVPNGRKRGYRLVPSLKLRTFWQTIEATKYHSDYGVKPNYQQLRFLALSSVINGAPGIIWFDVGFGTVPTEALINDAAQLAMVTNINAELHSRGRPERQRTRDERGDRRNPVTLQVTDRGGVPPSATAVILNVTATQVSTGSFVTVWPSGAAKPETSNLNMLPGGTAANLVITKLGHGGSVDIANAFGEAHLVADVTGYFVTDS